MLLEAGLQLDSWYFNGKTDIKITQAVQETLDQITDYWTGADIARAKDFASKHEAWARGYIETFRQADNFIRKVAHNNALRALEVGFSYGPGSVIESQIRREIKATVRNRAEREYVRSNPEPKMSDIGGKKD